MTVSSVILEHHIFFLDEDKWKTEARTERGAINDYTISYQNLVPDTSYTFRVIAYNKYGISYPAKSNDEVSHTKKKPNFTKKILPNVFQK